MGTFGGEVEEGTIFEGTEQEAGVEICEVSDVENQNIIVEVRWIYHFYEKKKISFTYLVFYWFDSIITSFEIFATVSCI